MSLLVLPSAIEPTEWFVVFHTQCLSNWLARLTPGRFKHVSAFGYCPGVKLWLCYDVQWSGTRLMLMDTRGIMTWTHGCTVVKFAPTGERMGLSSRLGLYCVNAVKHLLGLAGCVAATPTGLYRHIIRHGGLPISEPGCAAPDAHGPDAGPGAAAGPAGHDQVAAGPNPV